MAATVGSLRIELSASIAQFQEDMGKAASAVKATAAEFTKAGNDFKRIGAQMQSVGLALSKAITLPLVGISAAVAKVGMDFEDAFAGVKKTVQGTPQELQAISDAFREMSKTIPTSATELAKIGEIAGQMGVNKENIVEFTKTISQIATATHLTAEEAATSFAKLAVIMHVPQSQFESLGSAVYALGNYGNSTEKEMLDMGQRIANAGQYVGLTAGQVLGLSNALASAGIDAEKGGTAMSKLIFMMAKAAHDGGKELNEFAKVAGLSADEFQQKFSTDAAGTIVKFVQGMGQMKASGGDLLGTLVNLGIKNSNLRDSTLSLANAAELVAGSMDLGTKSFGDHAAFLAAVEARYKTTSNQLTILKNRISDVGVTLFTALKPAIEEGIKLVNILLPYIDSMAKAFASLPGGVQLTIIGIGAFAAALGPAIWVSGQLVSSFAQLTLAFGKGGIATRAIVGSIGLVEKAMGALGSAVLVDGAVMFEWGKDTVAIGGWLGKVSAAIGTLISGGLGPLVGAFEAVSGVIAALINPVTLVIGAFVALGLGMAALTGHWDDVKAGMSAVIGVVKDVTTVLQFWATNALEFARQKLRDFSAGLTELATAVGGDVVVEVKAFGTYLAGLGPAITELLSPLKLVAGYVAGPFIEAFQMVGGFFGSQVSSWATSIKTFVLDGINWFHEYAKTIREFATAVEEGFKTANKGLTEYRQSITDRAIPTAALEIGAAMALLSGQLKGIGKGGGNGFDELSAQLKAARAELAALSSSELASLTAAVKSGAFSMTKLQEATGLSDIALKLFEDQVRAGAKALKESESIFDEYRKKVAELTTALTEAVKVNVPVDFIARQFGSAIRDVVDQANILGKEIPKVISDAFLKITIKEGTDKLQKDFAKFGEELNKQVKADMDRVNATVIKTLGVIIDASQGTADAEAQFSIEGLKNQIKNLETVTGETKQSLNLRKQLYAEEYQYQVNLIQREAQAKKDALDKTDEFYNEALDKINQATAAKMGLASQAYQQRIKEMQTSTKRWTDSLGELGSAFSAIAQASGGAFSGVAKEIGSVISALNQATKAARDFEQAQKDYAKAVADDDVQGQYAAIGKGVTAVANGIAAVAQATSSKNKASAVIGGAITGAQVGSMIPGVGTLVGAGVGALVGYIRAIHKGPAEKAALDVGRDFGVSISEGLAKELGELRKTIGQDAANIFNLDKIIAEGGGLRSDNITLFTRKLRDTFSLVQGGALTAADGAIVLDKNFANFANHFLENGPLISKELVEIVRLTDDLGVSSKAVSAFIQQQVTGTILPGLQAYAGASKDATAALAENQKKLADLQDQLARAAPGPDQERIKKDIAEVTAAIQKEQGVIAATGVTSQAAADALSASVAIAFAEMMKAGTPILEIVDQLEPVVAALGQQFTAAGFAGGVAFQNIQSLVGLAADEIAGPALQATVGLGQALAGLSNIGQLNQETFSGLSDQIAATFNSLVAQGKDGNQILALMQGPLQTIWELSTEFGYAVDDGTKALLDQALAAGVVGERFKGPQQQMIDALDKTNTILGSIATALGATLPAAAQTAAAGITTAFSHVNPQVNVDINYNDPGFTPDVSAAGNLPGFRSGSGGVQDFGSGTLAMLHGREAVVTEHELMRGSQQPATGSGGDPIVVNVSINAIDSGSFRNLMTKNGGGADIIIDSISQGKRGRDERLRRGLALTNG